MVAEAAEPGVFSAAEDRSKVGAQASRLQGPRHPRHPPWISATVSGGRQRTGLSHQLLYCEGQWMRAIKTLKPGQKGTNFGPSRVRYRYDEHRREHLKAVELVVQRHFGNGNQSPGSRRMGTQAGVAARRVVLRISW